MLLFRLYRLKLLLLLSFFVLNTPTFAATTAPAFDLPTKNASISLEKLKGKVVYVDFWATWCAPCRKSFPWLNEMQSKYKDQGLVVVAINLDKDYDKIEEFLGKYPGNFTVAYDPEGKTAEQFKVMGMPSSYLIDRNGQIHMSHIGFKESDADKLETEIRNLLKQ